jgi:hypothetical protein
MIRRWTRASIFLLAVFVAAMAPTATSDPVAMTVHEWGTFTSIAGEDGNAVRWYPLSRPQDLPCFVERVRLGIKPSLAGTVRMETPVLYFYAPHETTIDVAVRFRQGFVTEWYPRATVTPAILAVTDIRKPDLESRIAWNDVLVSPRGSSMFPTEEGDSHYYAARATKAAPLRVGSQREKFLFYRGVGNFAPPLAAIAGADGTVAISNPSGKPVGTVVLFERRGERVGYRLGHAAGSRLSMNEPALGTRDTEALKRELLQVLVAEGLYQEEAAAMLETWRDSWFEEGTRLFYIPSKEVVDEILPLDVRPVPVDVARVFVGRLELVTPRTLQEVRDAIVSGDHATFRKFGRFAEPVVSRLLAAAGPSERAALEELVKASYASVYSSARADAVCQ